jgi:toxin-antitoxin system PIN domain toxin
VIVVDANLLIYAHVASFTQHETARQWLDEQINGSSRVGMPWPCLLGFIRIVTNPRVFERPETGPNAWKQVAAWLACDSIWIPRPTERHADILGDLIINLGIAANLVPDAHLAALAIEHGLTLYSTDSDFTRFPKLRFLNPLSGFPASDRLSRNEEHQRDRDD